MNPWFKKAVIGLAVILVLLVAIPAINSAYTKRRMLQAVQNARSIHLATISMAHDNAVWPGDLQTQGLIKNIGDFVEILVRSGELKPGELYIFSGPGFQSYKGRLDTSGHLDPPFTNENCAYRIYLVKDSDPANTIFLQSKPQKGKGIVVVRKGGDVSMYQKPQLPGDGTVESAENCLNP